MAEISGLDAYKNAPAEETRKTGRRMRVGIIGCGWIAESHAESYKRMEDVDIVALADIVPGKAEDFARRMGIEGATLYDSGNALIDGENDSDETARELAKLLKGLLCHVNLIPVNNVTGAGYKKSSLQRQQTFVDILSGYGVNATVRRTLGSDIDASCGQLKRNFTKGDV